MNPKASVAFESTPEDRPQGNRESLSGDVNPTKVVHSAARRSSRRCRADGSTPRAVTWTEGISVETRN